MKRSNIIISDIHGSENVFEQNYSKTSVEKLQEQIDLQIITEKSTVNDKQNYELKNTMQDLCRSFLLSYENSFILFQPATIAQQFNAKLRRVYDMTNILEGGGIIEKVEKSSYRWKGRTLTYLEDKFFQRNQWGSLKQISGKIINLFHLSSNGFTCHDLYSILTKQKGKFNPSTIRRRIYQCCKVFTIVGLIQKVGKFFYNGQLTPKDIQKLIKNKNISELQQLENRQERYKSYVTLESTSFQEQTSQLINSLDRKSLINLLSTELKNDQELQKFIHQLKIQFSKKFKNLNVEPRASAFSKAKIQFNDKLLYYEEQKMDQQRIFEEQLSQENYKIAMTNACSNSPVKIFQAICVSSNQGYKQSSFQCQ